MSSALPRASAAPSGPSRSSVSYVAGQGWSQTVLNPFALDPADPRTSEFYAPADYEGHACTSWRTLPGLRRWLAYRLHALRPDIVHAHLHHASVLIASIRRPPGARLVLSHQHGDHFRAIGAPRRELLDRLAGRRFDHVVGCSRYVERCLVERYHYPPAHVSCVLNGWAGQPIARSGIAGRTVVCVAQLRSQKNHRVLIDAVARVRATVPGVRLQLIGDGPERRALEAHVRALELNGTVEFVGHVADVWPLLARARVFALASEHEPLGIAALEAMAAGVPAVATRVGGLPEIVEEGVTGFLVAPGDSSEMAARLELLLTDDGLASRMGAEAECLAERHRAEHMVKGYARVYEQVLAGTGTR